MCNIIFTSGFNWDVSYKCQWIICCGKLISYINASLCRVDGEKTVNASWINLVLLSFEVLLYLRQLSQDCRTLHRQPICLLSDVKSCHFNSHVKT